MLPEIYKKKIIDILVTEVSPVFVVLFGSFAKGEVRGTSDIDLAYVSEEQKSPYDVFLIEQKIASELNKDVDLIDLKVASTVMQVQILHYGKLIYCKDKYSYDTFAIRSYKAYAKLNEERAVILQSIKERGEIYGSRYFVE